jgi:hypothetical protein
MTAQHFKELVETIQLTTAMSENEVGRAIKVSGTSIRWWKRCGLPSAKAPMIVERLRNLMRVVML